MNILYTTHCPKCKVLQQKLDQKGIQYQVCEDVNEMIKLGLAAAPALYTEEIGLMDFGKAVQWIREVSNAN